MSFKTCPQCGKHAALNSPGCTCGHTYTTQFTQSFPAALPYSDGPRDATEWRLNVFWFWVGAWAMANMAYTFARSFFIEGETWALVASIGALGALTFFGLRLRRLYVYSQFSSRMGGVTLAIVACLMAVSAFGIEQSYLREKRLAHAFDDMKNGQNAENSQNAENPGYDAQSVPTYSDSPNIRPRQKGETPRF